MLPSYQHYLNRFMMKQQEKAMPYLQNGSFGSRHNLSPYIPLQQLAMFAPWRSQKSLPQTQASDYWQLIHYGLEIKTWMFLYFLRSKEFLENNYYAKIGFVVFSNLITTNNLGYSIFSAFRIMFTAYSPNALLHCLNIFHIFRCSMFIKG